MMVVIKADTEEADKTKTIVSAQEKEANEKAAEAKAIADDAQVRTDEPWGWPERRERQSAGGYLPRPSLRVVVEQGCMPLARDVATGTSHQLAVHADGSILSSFCSGGFG